MLTRPIEMSMSLDPESSRARPTDLPWTLMLARSAPRGLDGLVVMATLQLACLDGDVVPQAER